MTTLDENLFEYSSADFAKYKDFATEEDTTAFVQLLNTNGIPYQVKKQTTLVDSAIIGSPMLPTYWIEIPRSDFKLVNALLEKEAELLTPADLSAHYLNQLSNEELLDIVNKSESWSPDAFIVAKALLKLRGVQLSETNLQTQRIQRIQEIRQPKEVNPTWLLFYFILAIASGALLFIWGIVACAGMGFYYRTWEETDPNGNKFTVFGPKTRKSGEWIVGLLIISAIMGIVWRTLVVHD
jgi:hypothetical protein